jgi:hypothetical protein
MFYENLKHHPLLALAIDKYRASKGTSSKRTSQWLIDRLEEAIELHQQHENTSFVEKALQTTGGHKVPGNPATPDIKPKKEIQDKEQKESKTKKEQLDKKAEKAQKDKDKEGSKNRSKSATVTAAPGASKGGGKGGKKGNGSTPKTEAPKNVPKEEKSKQPCMNVLCICFLHQRGQVPLSP